MAPSVSPGSFQNTTWHREHSRFILKCERKMAPLRHTGHRQLSAHLISADAESFATILILLRGAREASDYLSRRSDTSSFSGRWRRLLVERRRGGAGRRLKAIRQIARRRNTNHDYLPSIQLGARRTRKADPCERIFLGILRDHLVLQSSIRDDFRLADERRTGALADPDQGRAATPDALRLPTGRRRFDENLVVRRRNEPDRRGFALVAVFANRRNINVGSLGESVDVARRGRCERSGGRYGQRNEKRGSSEQMRKIGSGNFHDLIHRLFQSPR